MSKFRDLIVDTMEYEGMTAYRLSKETGISQDTIGRFLKGEQDTTVEKLEKILEALDIEIGG